MLAAETSAVEPVSEMPLLLNPLTVTENNCEVDGKKMRRIGLSSGLVNNHRGRGDRWSRRGWNRLNRRRPKWNYARRSCDFRSLRCQGAINATPLPSATAPPPPFRRNNSTVPFGIPPLT
jgi:hypothetical protein